MKLRRNAAVLDILDPTISTPREPIEYAARPTRLKGLRIGLLENTRRNSEAMLRRLARNLEVVHGMKLEAVVHKHQRFQLHEGPRRFHHRRGRRLRGMLVGQFARRHHSRESGDSGDFHRDGRFRFDRTGDGCAVGRPRLPVRDDAASAG
jgi:hypothetical protein